MLVDVTDYLKNQGTIGANHIQLVSKKGCYHIHLYAGVFISGCFM